MGSTFDSCQAEYDNRDCTWNTLGVPYLVGEIMDVYGLTESQLENGKVECWLYDHGIIYDGELTESNPKVTLKLMIKDGVIEGEFE